MGNALKDAAEETLRAHWRDLCDAATPDRMAYMRGAIGMALALGAISETEYKVWHSAIESCPGHDGGGRQWCAYCGDLNDRGNRDSGGSNG